MQYLDLVNVQQGTRSTPRFSNGNTLPLTQLPFGMAAFSLQTTSSQGSFFYHPEHRCLDGVRLTHQPSPWIGDYGNILFQPQCGTPYFEPEDSWSGYRPEEAILRPEYMQVRFLRYRCTMELTPVERGAMMRLTYQGDDTPRLNLRFSQEISSCRYDAASRCLIGYTKAHKWPVADTFATHFVLEFDTPADIEHTVVYAGGKSYVDTHITGENVGISLAFREREVSARLAISYIDADYARLSLERELGDDNFEAIRQRAADAWESLLSTIQVEMETPGQQRTFYSCMYRLFLFPRKFYEYDVAGKTVHFSPDRGGVCAGVYYTDNGFWDTFRTVYPLYALLIPDRYAEMLEGFVNTYKESGWLPKWPSPGEVGMMPGTLIDAVIADAAIKHIGRPEVLRTALEGMLKSATQESDELRFGRHGMQEYTRLGYVPFDKYRESVNHTLDYAYGDFCIAQTAAALGQEAIAAEYYARSGNYRRLFDSESGFMRARDTQGNWRTPFDPYRWGEDYCEGSAWQNSFAVYHDIEGLAACMGGPGALADKLDELFATEPVYRVGGYNREIHEMSEMAAVDFGQCAISNQPSFHIPYLYTLVGERPKAQYWLKRIMIELFHAGDDGFPGDEDNGSMAGWYIFSAMGFYPICPGKDLYVKGITLAKSIRIRGRLLQVDQLAGDCFAHSALMAQIGDQEEG